MQSPETFPCTVFCRSTNVLIVTVMLLAMAFLSSARCLAEIPTRAEIDDAQSIELPDDPAAILAVVGQSPIFLGELSPKVQARIDDVLSKTGQEIPADQLRFARINLTRGLLNQAIQNKMMRESFLLDQVGTQNADKRAEADATLAARARQMFYESELPQLQKQYKVDDLTELDNLLRKKGSSLSARQRDFADAMLGHLYIRSKVEQEPTVSLSEITEFYFEHHDEYLQKAAARWEQLTVLRSNYPDLEAAKKVISDMGREAYFGGNMQAVAREKSEEPFASSGGLHEWTKKGSLASDVLDSQVFQLPLNAMSEVIADGDGLHIVRVLGRREAGFTPLSEVQDEIRSKIREGKIAESQTTVMKEMEKRIPVWTLFPSDIPGAKPLPKSIASRQINSSAKPERF
ncbi:periplasmic folding chaperone [Planctomycetes bacterium CA13]|uniref:Periplasmic chaperone PpiD n=2 Tax=Novipirellula herctigrandis TaxID=2527986 RepID=A0A5C5Z0J8_9BACT|nr:periplasmic folding chaperone [Planctomycetes bacterium CA13]